MNLGTVISSCWTCVLNWNSSIAVIILTDTAGVCKIARLALAVEVWKAENDWFINFSKMFV